MNSYHERGERSFRCGSRALPFSIGVAFSIWYLHELGERSFSFCRRALPFSSGVTFRVWYLHEWASHMFVLVQGRFQFRAEWRFACVRFMSGARELFFAVRGRCGARSLQFEVVPVRGRCGGDSCLVSTRAERPIASLRCEGVAIFRAEWHFVMIFKRTRLELNTQFCAALAIARVQAFLAARIRLVLSGESVDASAIES